MRLLPKNESHCLAVFARAAAPRKTITVSEWAAVGNAIERQRAALGRAAG